MNVVQSVVAVFDRVWGEAAQFVPALGPITETKRIVVFTFLFAVLVHRILRRKRFNADKHYVVAKVEERNNFQFVGAKMPTLPEIPQFVSEMRKCADSRLSFPIGKRVEQLKRLRDMFVENEEAMLKALKSDLYRPGFEGLYYDVLLPLSEIDHLISHCAEWSAPEKKGFSLITFPSSDYVYKEPYGLVLVIGTWNYPIMLSVVPVAGAIAAGNSVVLKPCNVSNATAKLLAELIPRYLDPRVCSVVGTNEEGDRNTTAALIKCKFDHIFFTGSPSVGRVIMRGAAEHLTPCTLELGGKNPVFVAEDADIDLAAKRSVWGRMMNAGQQCIAPDYVLCHRSVLNEFTERCKYWTLALYGADNKTNGNFGRIVGASQTKRLIGLLKSHGGKVICGGNYDEKERYIEPTVLVVDLNSPTMPEETFGPILLVVPVDSMRAAIDYVNNRPKPLSLYLFSKSTATQEMIIHNTSSGGVTVNATLFHAGHDQLGFGGVGDSGMGAYHGKLTYDTFCHRKAVLKKAVWPDFGLLSDPFFLYPPWTDLKIKILRFLMKFV